MSILIINRFAHDRCQYEQWLKGLDEELLLLTSEEVMDSFPAKDYAYIESFPQFDINGKVELRAIELFARYQFHTIIAISERDVLRASHLRQRFGLQGQLPESAIHFRDKVIMKQIAQAHQLAVPHFESLSTNLDLIKFVERHGYPVVIKPIDGAGSQNIRVIDDPLALELVLESGIHRLAEVETFIAGDMYHVDGLVTEGEVAFISVSKYASGCLAYQSGGYNASYLISRDNPMFERLVTFTTCLLQVLDTPQHTAFHAELFHTPKDEIFLCEIASRTGGGRLDAYLEQAYGIHLTRAWVQAQCGIDLLEQVSSVMRMDQRVLTGDVLIPPKQGEFISGPSESPPSWVTEFRMLATPGQRYDHPKLSIDHIASFVVQGETEEEIEDRLTYIANWFEQSSYWK
ncbi:ATP-grasp domain-containing protein [Shimazuella sp. AN120528]|uniref:ATP-grasp domain-containing protein n=1 Tax=Shimazuella soli TaxID=1892854 RepID=UPI001F0F67A1|nr:ATP-grasp domain-containing protein [Shimazuella soli]MCH5586204.1 ATP-grasp domain-containing protein [Shimazuella soli]